MLALDESSILHARLGCWTIGKWTLAFGHRGANARLRRDARGRDGGVRKRL